MNAWAVNDSSTTLMYSTGMPFDTIRSRYGPKSCPAVALAAQQLQAIHDVGGASAELAAHLGHQERHVQHVELVGKKMRLEPVGKHQNRIVSHRTTYQGGLATAALIHHRTPA